MGPCKCFRESYHWLQLPNCNFVCMLLVSFFSLSYSFIFFFQNHSWLLSELGLYCSAELDVSLNLLHFEIRLKGFISKSVHSYYVICNMVIVIILFIKYYEENIETRHDRGRNVHIVPKCSSSVISPVNRISCC